MGPIESAAAALFVAAIGLGVLGALAAYCAIWITWIVLRRWGPRGVRGPTSGFPRMTVAILILVIGLPIGCVVVIANPPRQPPSNRQIAAVEVPLRTPADHADLLAMLRGIAREGGLHVDDDTEQWIQFRRQMPDAEEPESVRNDLTKTIDVGVWRGADDSDMEMAVDDGGHQGRAWIMFLRGKQPELATRNRVRLLAEIRRRWPDARDVPVMPDGSLLSADDLVWTGASYVVKPKRIAAYTR